VDSIVQLPSLFRLAKEISGLSTYKIRVGALLYSKGRPISVGYNQSKTHPRFSTPLKRTLHAEMHAIVSSGRDRLDGATIMVYREKKNGDIAMARPCENCLAVLRSMGVRTMVFSIDSYPFFQVEKIK
jgi:deoxycytidylate deaminase